MIFQSKLKYLAASILAVLLTSGTAFASLTSESRAALSQLRSQNSAAAKVSSRALAVLVFPNVVKAGFIFGAQGGEGILFVHGKTAGRYRTVAASYGLQAGVQKYGYALFFMNQKAVDWINNTRGWEVGNGPSVGIVDKGMARRFTKDRHHAQAAATARGSSREPCLGREVQGQALLCLSCGIWKSGLCRPAETVQRLQTIVAGPAGADGSSKRCRSQPAHASRRNSRTKPHYDRGIRRVRAFRNGHWRFLARHPESLTIDNEPASDILRRSLEQVRTHAN